MPTHKHKSKTYQQMLPQSAALESLPISTKVDKATKTAGAVHCRGEIPCLNRKGRYHLATGETESVTAPSIFVLAKSKTPLMPCHPARARELIGNGKAVIYRHQPFVIRLTARTEGNVQPIQLKLDPGAKTTGISVVVTATASSKLDKVVRHIELNHRKENVKKRMAQRKTFRRRRRTANLRCRKARFLNRGKIGKIAPSIKSTLDQTRGWINRLRRWAPITSIVIETARFDAQKIQNPEISGVEYQQGTLAGFEVKEYLLDKWCRKCAYCGDKNTPLEIEHIVPKSKGGSDRVSNLTLACTPCNLAKGNMDVADLLAGKPARLKAILATAKKPLASCATMNILKPRLMQMAHETGLPVTTATGSMTKFNRKQFGIPKTHALDAAFCGPMEKSLKGWNQSILQITATGRGSYQRTRTDKFGFPRLRLPRTKSVRGFQTGDLVLTPKGNGRIATRSSGYFALATVDGSKATINHSNCRLLQRADGYQYQQTNKIISQQAAGFLPYR
jgi:5-methylcytosine-specific restriction endonuclease McrA